MLKIDTIALSFFKYQKSNNTPPPSPPKKKIKPSYFFASFFPGIRIYKLSTYTCIGTCICKIWWWSLYDLQEYEQLQTQQKEIEDKLHEMENSHPRYNLIVFFLLCSCYELCFYVRVQHFVLFSFMFTFTVVRCIEHNSGSSANSL